MNSEKQDFMKWNSPPMADLPLAKMLPLSSGVYIYKINVGDPESSSGQGFSETKKMLLTK